MRFTSTEPNSVSQQSAKKKPIRRDTLRIPARGLLPDQQQDCRRFTVNKQQNMAAGWIVCKMLSIIAQLSGASWISHADFWRGNEEELRLFQRYWKLSGVVAIFLCPTFVFCVILSPDNNFSMANGTAVVPVKPF